MRTEKVEGWVQPWMRVDANSKDTISFDNFCNRSIRSDTPWTEYSIVLDVPNDSNNIAFGIMLGGKGHVWIDDFSFAAVGKNVRTTDCPCMNKNTQEPCNLNFEEGEADE